MAISIFDFAIAVLLLCVSVHGHGHPCLREVGDSSWLYVGGSEPTLSRWH